MFQALEKSSNLYDKVESSNKSILAMEERSRKVEDFTYLGKLIPFFMPSITFEFIVCFGKFFVRIYVFFSSFFFTAEGIICFG